MAERGTGPDFIESLARGLEVIRAFDAQHPELTMSELAELTGLARPTVRRILLTLEELGYVRAGRGGFSLTPRVLQLGLSFVSSSGLWDAARPHMQQLVSRTGESSSAAQLDGADIVYVARVAVPKIIALRVDIGTRFPAASTSLGKVLMSELTPAQVEAVLAHPSRSGVVPRLQPDLPHLLEELAGTRERGWCLTDEQLAAGVRSVAAPLRDASGCVVAAMNVTVHAAETSVETLLAEHLPRLLETTQAINADLALLGRLPLAGTH
ncbi:IclR family transcriptional regulator domain-containing protein [Nocardioides bruguierae]|uniref:IclR family transcriptional regulator domain-containing protein n=1 Tax=Nocardioides bruguierae TaxID=2945102 RepID=UPI0020203AB4|nr:IclR family transcriptional regulator C-terminal domain-containing protein [Nocardioides bruguierae]MCL8024496.1 helix-turn-helix domain-containing protein [Nocardioides bruguierae]